MLPTRPVAHIALTVRVVLARHPLPGGWGVRSATDGVGVPLLDVWVTTMIGLVYVVYTVLPVPSGQVAMGTSGISPPTHLPTPHIPCIRYNRHGCMGHLSLLC
jgi:hypothetical protein